MITAWLVTFAEALPRTAAPIRVLSIGCGDGSVDVEVARVLAGRGPVSYRGIEPHAPSAALFAQRLGLLNGVDVAVETVPFDALPAGTACYDLVIAVHSLYYVPDLPAALDAAHALLAPGGRLAVVHAPREALNALVGVLAPGRRQEFSDAVARAIKSFGWSAVCQRIDATLALGRCGDARWRDLLDFTVQAIIPDALVDAVERALRAAALPNSDGGLAIAHPVDTFVISAR